MTRFGFCIRTRSGQRVDNLLIVAATRDIAERRLRQMYLQCGIVACRESAGASRTEPLDVEAVIALISGAPPPATIAPGLRRGAAAHTGRQRPPTVLVAAGLPARIASPQTHNGDQCQQRGQQSGTDLRQRGHRLDLGWHPHRSEVRRDRLGGGDGGEVAGRA